MPPTPWQVVANPPQKFPSLHPYAGPWLSQGLLPLLGQVALPPVRARYVSPIAGNVAATGAQGDPFNPASAAAGFAGDPFGQAFASFPLATTTGEEAAGFRVFAGSGFYPNPIAADLSALRFVIIFCDGPVIAPSASFQRLCGPGLGSGLPPILAISSSFLVPVTSQLFQTSGACVIDLGGDESPNVLAAVYAAFGPGSLVSIVSGTTVPFVQWQSTTQGDLLLGPSGALALLDGSAVAGSLVCGQLLVADGATFGPSVTVAAPGALLRGCGFSGGVPTWNGPAGSARFDPATAAAWASAPAPQAFTGGASLLDYDRPDTITAAALLALVVPGTAAADLVVGQPRTIARAWAVPKLAPIAGAACDAFLTLDGAPVAGPLSLLGAPVNVPLAFALPAWPSLALQANVGSVLGLAIVSAAGVAGGPVALSVDLQRDFRPL